MCGLILVFCGLRLFWDGGFGALGGFLIPLRLFWVVGFGGFWAEFAHLI